MLQNLPKPLHLIQLLERLGMDQGPKRVLIVEDQVHFALGLQSVLQELGHQVSTFAGVAKVEGNQIVGIPIQESEVNLPWPVMDIHDIDIAFLDHYFATSRRFDQHWDGGSLCRQLSHSNVKVMGMSSVSRANDAMMLNGATYAMVKLELGNLADI